MLDQALTSAYHDGQLTPWRAARISHHLPRPDASAVRLECSSNRLSHTNHRRIHSLPSCSTTSPTPQGRRTSRSRVSCTLWPRAVRATRTPHGRRPAPSISLVSTTTASTRTWRQVQPHPLAIALPLIMSIRFQQGPDPSAGTVNHPAPPFMRRLKQMCQQRPLDPLPLGARRHAATVRTFPDSRSATRPVRRRWSFASRSHSAPIDAIERSSAAPAISWSSRRTSGIGARRSSRRLIPFTACPIVCTPTNLENLSVAIAATR